MSQAEFDKAVMFGPFQMPHLQEHVNNRLRDAFYTYLKERVIPAVEGRIMRVEGRFHSHYDRPEFASNATVRRRYYYTVDLISDEGTEDAWGELDYDPVSAALTTNHVKPPGVRILSVKRSQAECEREARKFREQYAEHPKDYCPRCQSKAVATIQYGLVPLPVPPSFKAMRDEGLIVSGGCCVNVDSPAWHCLDCGSSWGCGHTRRWLEAFHRLISDNEERDREDGQPDDRDDSG